MANELRHSDVGTALSKTEWEAVGTHVFNDQAAGDTIYASSTTQLTRLPIGAAKTILSVNSAGTAPEWVASPAVVTALVPDAADGATIGTAALEFSDVYLADGAVIYLGDDSDVTLTHVHNIGLLLNSTMAIQFNDSSQYINAPTNAILDINATDEIELNATLADVNANLDVSGTYTGGGLMTTGGNIVIPNAGNIGSASDTDAIAISSGGVVTMNQIPVFSAGINVSGGTIAGTIATATQNSITTMTGLVTTSALNSGSITSGFGNINTGSSTITTTGAADLGATTVDSLTSTGTITGGSDGSGVDVVLYSGTAGDNLTWDASEEQLIITGTNGTTSLNVADGNVAIADDLDVDGTLEADAYTVDGTTLAEYIADTVGAMVGSNTETNITVTYEDGDNTLDFVIGTLNQDTTGTAAIATAVTITDNESTDEDNAVIFTAGGDVDGGNLGLESDGNLTYNPSTGRLTATQLAGAIQTASQTAITGVGTITTGEWNGTVIASGYIAADAITGAKIADDAIDSEHYTDGSIDNAHIADDAIDSEHYAAASIDFAHIQNVAANSILGRNANSSGVLSEVALATTQILIGDGTGFTAAALSGDATMTNAGVVSLAAAQTNVTSLLATDIKIGEDDQTKIDFEDANTINFYANNAKEVVLAENSLSPGTSDGTALGTTSLMWSDLFVASGSVLNFNNGDMTVTHSSNTLTVAGGTLAAAAITGTTIDATTDFTIGATVITDGVITDASGLSIAAAVDLGSNTLTSTGSMQIRTIDYSDGDLAMTIADGGAVSFAAAHAGLSTTMHTSSSHIDRNMVYENVKEVTGVTSYATQFTLTPSVVSNLWTRGIIYFEVSGHTSAAGSGTRSGYRYFDIADDAPTVGDAGSDRETGTPPAFRVTTSTNDILLQVQSYNASNAIDGTLYVKIMVPRGAGSAGGSVTYSVT